MIQRVIPHLRGRFSRCRNCGSEPRHIESRGSSSAEPTRITRPTGTRHSLECRCGKRTERYATVAQAESQWGVDYAQLSLPLHASRKRQVAA